MAARRKASAKDQVRACGCLVLLAVGLISGLASLIGGGPGNDGQSGSSAGETVSPSPAPDPTRTAVLAKVAGQGLDKVEAQLRASGFTWHAYFPDDTVDDPDQMGDPSAFIVCQQSPAPGQYRAASTTVQLAVVGSAIGCDATLPPTAGSLPGEGAATGGSSKSGTVSNGATALCNDGTLSYSQHHQGTCSHHGGVAVWYK